MNTQTYKLKLEGLGCTHCAGKIETRTSKLKTTEKVNLNFAMSTIEFTSLNGDKDSTITRIKKIVKELEPDVRVYEIPIKSSSQNSSSSNSDIVASNTIPTNIKEDPSCSDGCCGYQHEDDDSNHSNNHKPDNHSHSHGHSHGDNDSPTSNFKRKLKLGLSLGLFIMGLFAIQFELSNLLIISIFAVAYGLVGLKVVGKSISNIKHGDIFDENFLMTIASIGAIALGEYPEAVAVMIFYEFGEYFQDLAVDKSRKSIGALINLKPEIANILQDGQLISIKPEKVKIGDILVVKPGESVPLDGDVIKGKSTVDTSALTGESVPIKIKDGSKVLSGSLNLTEVVHIEVTSDFENSTISKILDLVQNASGQKSKTEAFITKFAKVYTPIVVGLAAVIAIIPPLFLGADPSEYVYSALIFLVISCPCALVVSVPLGYYSGIGNASKHGVLVKGGNYLEALTEIDTILFDKTGTLTEGKFKVAEIIPAPGYDKLEILKYAAVGESLSNHPIAKSIVDEYELSKDKYHSLNIELANLSDSNIIDSYEEISGYGIKASYCGKELLLGNKKLMEKFKLKFDDTDKFGTLVYIALDNKFIGCILINDSVKKDSKDAIEKLKLLGIKEITMLTGDSESTASEVASMLGVDSYESELLPQDKYNIMLSKKENGKKIIFVGDGINDAPVLAASDVGVSMGSLGSDAAIEASDIVLMTDEPTKLVEAIKIAKKTKIIVSQNIIFALSFKILIMGFSLFGIGTMWTAIFADVGIALLAILNSSRVLRYDPS